MAHATHLTDGGVAANAHDFIKNKLIPFALTVGWTRSQADVNIGTNEEEMFLAPPAGGDIPYIYFHTRQTHVYMFAATGFNAARAVHDQPGSNGSHPVNSGGNPSWTGSSADNCVFMNAWGTGPLLGHYLFAPANGRYVHAAVQIATRVWRHMFFGRMDKLASFTGGEYYGGTYWDQGTGTIDAPYSGTNAPGLDSIYVPSDYKTCHFRAVGLRNDLTNNWWKSQNVAANSTPTHTLTRPTGAGWANASGTSYVNGNGNIGARGGLGTMLFRLKANPFSGAKALLPIVVYGNTIFEGNSRFCAIGSIADVFRVNMFGYSAAASITIGSDTYKVFPVTNHDQVNTPQNTEYSGFEGYAYKVIA